MPLFSTKKVNKRELKEREVNITNESMAYSISPRNSAEIKEIKLKHQESIQRSPVLSLRQAINKKRSPTTDYFNRHSDSQLNLTKEIQKSIECLDEILAEYSDEDESKVNSTATPLPRNNKKSIANKKPIPAAIPVLPESGYTTREGSISSRSFESVTKASITMSDSNIYENSLEYDKQHYQTIDDFQPIPAPPQSTFNEITVVPPPPPMELFIDASLDTLPSGKRLAALSPTRPVPPPSRSNSKVSEINKKTTADLTLDNDIPICPPPPPSLLPQEYSDDKTDKKSEDQVEGNFYDKISPILRNKPDTQDGQNVLRTSSLKLQMSGPKTQPICQETTSVENDVNRSGDEIPLPPPPPLSGHDSIYCTLPDIPAPPPLNSTTATNDESVYVNEIIKDDEETLPEDFNEKINLSPQPVESFNDIPIAPPNLSQVDLNEFEKNEQVPTKRVIEIKKGVSSSVIKDSTLYDDIGSVNEFPTVPVPVNDVKKIIPPPAPKPRKKENDEKNCDRTDLSSSNEFTNVLKPTNFGSKIRQTSDLPVEESHSEENNIQDTKLPQPPPTKTKPTKAPIAPNLIPIVSSSSATSNSSNEKTDVSGFYFDVTKHPNYKTIPANCPEWRKLKIEEGNRKLIDEARKLWEAEQEEERKWEGVPSWKRNLKQAKTEKKKIANTPAENERLRQEEEQRRFNELPDWKKEILLKKKN